jgi:hypothetical protein
MPTMHRNDICVLRTQLRELNIEYSALVRKAAGETCAARMDELRVRRRLLMSLIAEAATVSPARAYPAPAALATVVQAA